MENAAGMDPINENADYDEQKCRAEWIYENIRGKYFDQYFRIEESEIGDYEVEIEASYYYSCDNSRDYSTVTFPVTYLSMSNEELDALFKQEYEQKMAIQEQKRLAKLEEDSKKYEQWERKNLLELLNKYGIPDEYKGKQNG